MTGVPAVYPYGIKRIRSSKPASATRLVWVTCDSVSKTQTFLLKGFFFFRQYIFILYFPTLPRSSPPPYPPDFLMFLFQKKRKTTKATYKETKTERKSIRQNKTKQKGFNRHGFQKILFECLLII